MLKSCYSLIILMLGFICLTGCSSNPTNTEINSKPDDKLYFPIPFEKTNESGRSPLGFWIANFDTGSLKADVESDRLLCTHYNITSLVPPPGIFINSYDPGTFIMDVDVFFSNPYPIDVYDLRLIIFTDDIGHKMLNADSWTAIYDIPEGLPINPFKAFAKDKPKRKFTGQTQNGVNMLIYLPDGNPTIKFAVDASFPSNCEEPYEISGFTQGVLYDEVGSSTNIEVSVLDWQNDVNSVMLYCPEILGAFTPLSQINNEKWGMTLVNNMAASEGNYSGYFIATSPNPGCYNLYNEVTITVTTHSNQPFGWARTWGGSSGDKGSAITLDTLGNIYVAGSFGNSVDFDPGTGTDIHTSNGGYDVFLCKYNPDGNFIWARTWGGIADDKPTCAHFKPGLIIGKGDIYAAGYFSNSVDFDPGTGEDIHNSSGGNDIFLAKFDQDGAFNWARTWGGSSDDGPSSLDIFSSDIYLTGGFKGTVDFDPGSGVDWHSSHGKYDAFMSKLDVNGSYYWTLTWGGVHDDGSYGIAIDDNSGNSFVIGTLDENAFLFKFDFNGDLQWTRSWDNGLDYAFGLAVNVSQDGSIYASSTCCDYDYCICILYLTKFDSYGDSVWSRYLGDSSATAVLADELNNVYLLGITSDEYIPAHGFWRKYTSAGDFTWEREWGEKFFCNSIAVNPQGHIYVSGNFANSIDFDLGPGLDRHYSYGSSDAYLMKYYF